MYADTVSGTYLFSLEDFAMVDMKTPHTTFRFLSETIKRLDFLVAEQMRNPLFPNFGPRISRTTIIAALIDKAWSDLRDEIPAREFGVAAKTKTKAKTKAKAKGKVQK
jgi:hypothetical protein